MTRTRPRFTAMQRLLLLLFRAHPGEVLSRDQIMDEVWGVEYDGFPTLVDRHISNLRVRLGEAAPRGQPSLGGHIETVSGAGYLWRVEG